MGRDIIVRWPKGVAGPDLHETGNELEAYLANNMGRVSLGDGQPGAEGSTRWLADLHGRPEVRAGLKPEDMHECRWFEVYVGPDYIDIITREMDDVTNAIAEGFAARCARKWKGKVER
jgi:hypothetical protein